MMVRSQRYLKIEVTKSVIDALFHLLTSLKCQRWEIGTSSYVLASRNALLRIPWIMFFMNIQKHIVISIEANTTMADDTRLEWITDSRPSKIIM